MPIRICLSGATGEVGRALLPAILGEDDLELVSAVGRRRAGEDAGVVAGGEPVGVPLSATLEAALDAASADVLIDYTAPAIVMATVDKAIDRGIDVVLGTTGLSAADFDDVDTRARARGVGLVSGNFALTAALLQHFALFAARHLDDWEVIDVCQAAKPDAPSGTARELAEHLGRIKRPGRAVPVADTHGLPEARGAEVAGVQCHSIRLPGFVSSVEVLFGSGSERLSLRHEAISHGEPFVAGTLLAARKVGAIDGVVRGLDRLLFDAR